MFGWIRNWLRRKRFENTRMLFEYFDGTRLRKVDPLKAWMVLRDHPQFNVEDHPELVALSLSEPETTYMQDALCEAFGVERYDDKTNRGLTIEDMCDLLTDLILFLNELQKKTPNGSTPLQPTESESSTGPVVPDATPDCSSRSATPSTEPNSAGEPQSPTRSRTPTNEFCR